MNAAGVAHLNGSGLAAEEDGLGEELGCHVRRFEDDVFFIVGRSGEGGAGVPEQGSYEQEHSERREATKHGASLIFDGRC